MDSIENFNSSRTPNRTIIRAFSAVIDEIVRERNTTFVTISYHTCSGCSRLSDTVRLVVNQNTDIFDEWGQKILANELRRGMTVDASFSSAMTRSIPPQSQAYFIRIVERADRTETTVGRIAEVNTRNQFIIVMTGQSPLSAIRFHVSNETSIFDFFGRQIRLSALRPGFRVRVEHGSFMTASIPPQTTAFTIQVVS